MNRPDVKFIHEGSEIAKTMDPKCTFTETKFNSSIVFYLSVSTNSIYQLQHSLRQITCILQFTFHLHE